MSPEPKLNVTLTGADVRNAAIERLRELLPEEIAGYIVDNDMILDLLVYAAVEGKSLHSASGSLGSMANDDTIRNYINACFPAAGIYDLNLAVNRLLQADLPDKLRKGRRDLAIDLHDRPYYGHAEEIEPWLHRAKAKDGTTRFLRIATVDVMHHGLRFTLAVKFIHPGQTLPDILSWLLTSVRRAGIRILRLWLDRGFASGGVVRRLEAMRLSAIIACPIRGQNGGTRALCQGRKTYHTYHGFSSATYGDWSAYVSVVRGYSSGQRKPRRARWFLYIQVGCRLPDRTVHALYRRRFGIESSYRILNQVRAHTTSRNPALRFLILGIALILINLWVTLRFSHCRTVRRAKDVIHEERLRLWRLRDFLRHAIEQLYDLITAINIVFRPLRPALSQPENRKY